MAGIMIRSGVPITGSGFPKLYPDKRMSAGSLLLIDLANGSVVQPSAVVNGMVLPNLAWKQAAALIGAGNLDSLSPVFTNNMSSGQGLVEITAKKGLHTITSETSQAETIRMNIALPDALKTYFLAHPNNDYYMSLHRKVTRKYVAAGDFYRFTIGSISGPTTNALVMLRQGATVPISGANRLGHDQLPDTNKLDLGDRFWSIGTANFSGTAPTLIANLNAYYRIYPNNGSEILYSMYIEDLTVSGRTYATVQAIDAAIYTQSLAVGGKYYGDTYTNPSTIA